MPSIVDTIYSIGYPLLYLPLHHVGSRVAKLAGCEYSGTPVAAAIGSASPTNFAESVADFNGTSSTIELPNFGDLVSGAGGLSIACWFKSDSAGLQWIFDLNNGSNSTIIAYITPAARVGGRAASTESLTSAENTVDNTSDWILTGSLDVRGGSVLTKAGATSFNKTNTTFSQREIEDVSGRPLCIGSLNGLGNWFTGRLHSLAIWRDTMMSEADHAALAAATTLGQWCTIDIGGDTFQSGNADYTGSNLEYSLRKGGPDGLLLDRGSDLAITAGVCAKEFYVPEAGNDYWLNINDPANTLVGAGRQVALASV